MAEVASNKASGSDTAKLVVAALVFAGGLFAYYWYSDVGFIFRFMMALAGVLIGVAIAATSFQGRRLGGFMRDVRQETRRVIWPTRQETMQTTLIVLLMVLLVGIFLWLVDMVFGFAFQSITKLGG